MAYKKYIRRGDKSYGPYLYHSKREGGRVVSHYGGRHKKKFCGFYFLYAILIFSAIAAVAFSFYENNVFLSPQVGEISFEFEEGSVAGDEIVGTLNFDLLEGTTLPSGARVVVYVGDYENEYELSDLTGFLSHEDVDGLAEGAVLDFDLLVYERFDDFGITGSGVITGAAAAGTGATEIQITPSVETASPAVTGPGDEERSAGGLPPGVEEASVSPGGGSSGGGSGGGESEGTGEETGTTETEETPIEIPNVFFDSDLGVVKGEIEEVSEFSETEREVLIYEGLRPGQEVKIVGDVKFGEHKVSKESVKLDKSSDGRVFAVFTPTVVDVYAPGERIGLEIGNADLVLFEDSIFGVRVFAESGEVLMNFEKFLDVEEVSQKQFDATLNEPVRWIQRKGADLVSREVVFEVPESAQNIRFRQIKQFGKKKAVVVDARELARAERISNIESLYRPGRARLSIIGHVIFDEPPGVATISKDVAFDVSAKENYDTSLFEIEYWTPAPTVILEEETSSKKTVKVSGAPDIGYENVLIYSKVPGFWNTNGDGKVKVLWVEGSKFLEPEFEDTNSDGVDDLIKWVAPRLSDQTFEIIYLAKAEHLDGNKVFVSSIAEEVMELDGVWSEPIPAGHFVRVTFEEPLDNSKDITLFARSVTAAEVKVLLQGGAEVADFGLVSETGEYKALLENIPDGQSYDVFDLAVSGGSVEFDWIVDPVISGSLIAFGEETPADGSIVGTEGFEVDLETLLLDEHYVFLNFNGDVLLWYRMDDFDATSLWDVSGNYNDGTFVGDAGINNSGYWGRALELSASDAVEIVEDGGLRPTGSFSVSSWVWLGDGGDVLSYGNGSDFAGLKLRYDEGFDFVVFDGGGERVVSSDVAEPGWHHVCGVFEEEGLMEIYVDGVLEDSAEANWTVSYGSFGGAWKLGGFDGLVDELIVFDRALGATEVEVLYDAFPQSYSGSFEDLDYGVYAFRGFLVDKNGIANWTEERQVLVNALPSVTLVSPDDGEVVDETPVFGWKGFDLNDDSLVYDLNISLVSRGNCSEPDRIIQGIAEEGFAFSNLIAPLGCYAEDGDSYVWKVRAFDGFSYGNWSGERSFEVEKPVLPSPPVETLEMIVNDANVGENVRIYLRVGGGAGEGATLIDSMIEIYDPAGEKVETVDLGSEQVQALEFVEYNVDLATAGYVAGDYRAVAVVEFDGEEKTTEAEFRLGSLYVGIVDHTRYLKRNEINEIFVEVQNYWSAPIPDVYASIKIGERAQFQTPAISLNAWETARLTRDFDTRGVDGKDLSVEITVYYNGAETSETVQMSFERGADSTLISLVVIVIVALVAVLIFFGRYFSKSKKRRRS